jgi:hypothetical protein
MTMNRRSTAAGTTGPDTTVNGYRTIGYFPQWKSDAGYTAKRLVDEGVIGQLTHINYAFANIHPETLTCFISNHPGGPVNTAALGDFQGYARRLPAAVHGRGVGQPSRRQP